MAYNKIYDLLVKVVSKSEISKILRIDTFNQYIEYISDNTYVQEEKRIREYGIYEESIKLFTIQLNNYIFNPFVFKITAIN